MSEKNKEINEENLDQVAGGLRIDYTYYPECAEAWNTLFANMGYTSFSVHKGSWYGYLWFSGLAPWDVSYGDGLSILRDNYPDIYAKAETTTVGDYCLISDHFE